MNVYIYNADVYCEKCGEAIRELIARENLAPEDPHDRERYFGSLDYPQGPVDGDGVEADGPQHCGKGKDCLNAIVFDGGCKIGCWLKNELTNKGVEYVKEVICEGGEVADLWHQWYSELGYVL